MTEYKTVVGSKQRNAYIGSIHGACPTLTSAMGMGGGMIPIITTLPEWIVREVDFMLLVR